MDPRVEAGKKLLGQHTVRPPAMSSPAAAKHLSTFLDVHPHLTPEQLPWVVAKAVELQDATLTYLKYQFTPLDLTQVDRSPSGAQRTAAALAIVPHMGRSQRAEFLEQVVFNVAHPAHHRLLAPPLLSAIPAAEIGTALLQHVDAPNELHINNAIHLFQELAQRRRADLTPDFTLTFIAAARRVRERPNLNLLVNLALDELGG